MKVEKKDLGKSQIELDVELSPDEFRPYINKGAAKVSREVKIDGFRPGKIPFDILKQKIGEMTILEESARIAIDDTIGKAIKEHVEGRPVGQPKVDISKLAPDNPLGYKVVLALIPEIELKEYKGLKIKEKKAAVKEDEVERTLSNLQEMRAREAVVEREIKDRDKVIVDINMFLDKVPVEGGQSKDTAVIIGKDYIIPGFDKQLLDAKKGEAREFKLPYPNEFHMKNLAGKMVEFKVIIKEVYQREVPALDDEFALGFGVKKFKELEDNIRKSLTEQRSNEAKMATEKEMLEKLINKNRIGDIPELLVESETETMFQELERAVETQGGKFSDYLNSLNKTRDQLTLDMLPEAVKRVKVSLIIREIANKEGIKVSDEEINKHIEEMREHYSKHGHKESKDILERIKTPEYKAYVANVFTSKKVVDKLFEWNVVD